MVKIMSGEELANACKHADAVYLDLYLADGSVRHILCDKASVVRQTGLDARAEWSVHEEVHSVFGTIVSIPIDATREGSNIV